jgi:hypothetical protein
VPHIPAGHRLPFMSILRRLGSPADEPGVEHVERRRATREGIVSEGTLACPRCDAPVSPGADGLSVASRLCCPYCAHGGPLREFLSLARPTRPAHVRVRVALRGAHRTSAPYGAA